MLDDAEEDGIAGMAGMEEAWPAAALRGEKAYDGNVRCAVRVWMRGDRRCCWLGDVLFGAAAWLCDAVGWLSGKRTGDTLEARRGEPVRSLAVDVLDEDETETPSFGGEVSLVATNATGERPLGVA